MTSLARTKNISDANNRRNTVLLLDSDLDVQKYDFALCLWCALSFSVLDARGDEGDNGVNNRRNTVLLLDSDLQQTILAN